MAVTQAPYSMRDLSYACSARTRGGRAVIRMMENTTGRRSLLRRARGYEDDLALGANFFDIMASRYGLNLEIAGGALENVPRTGPLIVVANHPYGLLDGLMMGHLLARRRPDFRIMANSVFAIAPELAPHLLPVSFEQSKDATALNLQTRRDALAYLGQGGAIGIFPGGTVSTAARPFSRPMDPRWRRFTARLIAKSDAAVLPVYFDGHTSRLFQIASHLHTTLRMGLLLREFRARVDTRVRVVVGKPLDREILQPMGADAKAMMDFLRKATYDLALEPADCFAPGYDFEDRHRCR